MQAIDVLQAASNAVAGNVTGPVDILSLLLRKIGVPVPENALGSSQWAREQGLLRDVDDPYARAAGESLGIIAPMVAAAKAPQIARGLLKAGDNLAAPRTLDPQTGAIVWHGTPHKFDRFDSSKIGTGEGAQAYGHGLYLAESPEVATQYQRALSGRASTQVGGKNLIDLPISDDARGFVQQVAASVQRGRSLDDAAGVLRMNIQLGHPNAKAMREALSVLDGGVSRGNLYKVDLPDSAIARMLDWDKPLSQQAAMIPRVREAMAAKGFEPWQIDSMIGRDITGEQVNAFVGGISGQAKTPEHLRKAGIPGIRYLDGGSRAAGTGTRNYVVFPGEEALLTILERNGIPLP